MQLVPRYLVKQRVNIIANEAGYLTEYRPVYRKQLQVYKGIDNILEFRLLNADQKPMDLDGYSPKFMAFDDNKALVIEHTGTVLQQGDSTETIKKGVFTITITENDLLGIKEQYLSYNIYLVDNNNQKVLTYTDSHFGNDGVIFVNANQFPGPQPTYSVSNFSQVEVDEPYYVTEGIDAQPGINGNEALHTAAMYSDGYVGDIIIQGTLDNQLGEYTVWSDIATVVFTGDESQPVPVNFNGVFTYIRFKATENPASTLSKILTRN